MDEHVHKLKKLYLCVTADEYELPLIVADSLKEMTAKTGIANTDILSRISHGYKPYKDGRGRSKEGIRFYKIFIEE